MPTSSTDAETPRLPLGSRLSVISYRPSAIPAINRLLLTRTSYSSLPVQYFLRAVDIPQSIALFRIDSLN